MREVVTAGRAWQPRRPKSAEVYSPLLYLSHHFASLRDHVSLHESVVKVKGYQASHYEQQQ